MLSLIRKEWREHRVLIYALFLLTPVASLLVKWLVVGFKETCVIDSLLYVTPVAFTIFVLAISSDLGSEDIASGRSAFFAALPISPARLWGAKSVFLMGSSLLFLGYFLLSEVCILHFLGKDLALLSTPVAERATYPLLGALAAGTATFFFSTLLDRGIAAALAGFGLVAGGRFVFQDHLEFLNHHAIESDLYLPASILLIVASLIAAVSVFLAGRTHLQARLRRVVVGGGMFLLILVPATVWAGVSGQAYLDVDPSEDELSIRGGIITPDGKWALVAVTPARKPPFALHRSWEDWAVNLETGQIREYGEFGERTEGRMDSAYCTPGRMEILRREDSGFTRLVCAEEPGRLVLFRREAGIGRKQIWLRVVYDLGEGRPISTRVVDRSEATPIGTAWESSRRRARSLLAEHGFEAGGWTIHSRAADWGVVLLNPNGGNRNSYGVLRFDSGMFQGLPRYPHHRPDEPDGYALHIGGSILRMPLDGGEPEEIECGAHRWEYSPDQSCSVAVTSETVFFLRGSDGAVLRAPVEVPLEEVRIQWAPDASAFLVYGETWHVAGSATADGLTVRRVNVDPRVGYVTHFDGHRVLGVGWDQRGFYLGDIEGACRQLLPAPEAETTEVQ